MSDNSERALPPAPGQPPLTTVMDGAVAVLSMGLAPYNLMDRALNRELIDGLDWAKREGARAVVLRSSLRHFSAGADLDAMVADADRSDVLDWGLVETLRAFDEHPAPVIASIRGARLGGGFELALACDLIVASESAKIGSVEVTVGLHPLMGAVQRLTQRAGAARAKEMALLGRRYPASTITSSTSKVTSSPRWNSGIRTRTRQAACTFRRSAWSSQATPSTTTFTSTCLSPITRAGSTGSRPPSPSSHCTRRPSWRATSAPPATTIRGSSGKPASTSVTSTRSSKRRPRHATSTTKSSKSIRAA